MIQHHENKENLKSPITLEEKLENLENLDNLSHSDSDQLLGRKLSREYPNTYNSVGLNDFDIINSLKNTQNQEKVESSSPKKIVTCNCKSSQCLKLYCECFAAKGVCDPKLCSCQGCSNTLENFDLRKEKIAYYSRKNSKAFRKSSLSIPGESKELCCTCKKSNCNKKYCECYQNGLKCGSNCKCLECKNTTEESNDAKASTRTSSFSMSVNGKSPIDTFQRKTAPCLIVIDNYILNKKFLLDGSA